MSNLAIRASNIVTGLFVSGLPKALLSASPMPVVTLGGTTMMYRRGDTLAIAILLSLLDCINAQP